MKTKQIGDRDTSRCITNAHRRRLYKSLHHERVSATGYTSRCIKLNNHEISKWQARLNSAPGSCESANNKRNRHRRRLGGDEKRGKDSKMLSTYHHETCFLKDERCNVDNISFFILLAINPSSCGLFRQLFF